MENTMNNNIVKIYTHHWIKFLHQTNKTIVIIENVPHVSISF